MIQNVSNMHGIFIYWCFVCTLAIFSPRGQDCGWHFWLLADYMKDIPWQREKNRLVLGPFGHTKLVYVNLHNYKICAILKLYDWFWPVSMFSCLNLQRNWITEMNQQKLSSLKSKEYTRFTFWPFSLSCLFLGILPPLCTCFYVIHGV